MSDLQPIVLAELPAFTIMQDGEIFSTTWDYFNQGVIESTIVTKVEPEELIASGKDVDLNLDDNISNYPTDWESIKRAEQAINTRIEKGLPFDHFTNYTNPTFFYRIAAGIKYFGEEYVDALENNPDSAVLVTLAFVLANAQQQQRIDAVGYSLTGVFATNGGEANFVYTKGLVPGLICIGNLDINVLGQITDIVAKSVVQGSDHYTKGDAVTLADMVIGTGEELRIKLVDVTDETMVERYGTLKQIIYGDSKNILPDEEGYDVAILQTGFSV